ncbi:MAG: hypothetical protein J6R89_08325 [Clostridia bacterium]|nr:hypothetical protein [Clostridia bacterium]
MGFCTSLVSAGIGLVFSAILVNHPLALVIGLMLGITVALLVAGLFFYRMVLSCKAR